MPRIHKHPATIPRSTRQLIPPSHIFSRSFRITLSRKNSPLIRPVIKQPRNNRYPRQQLPGRELSTLIEQLAGIYHPRAAVRLFPPTFRATRHLPTRASGGGKGLALACVRAIISRARRSAGIQLRGARGYEEDGGKLTGRIGLIWPGRCRRWTLSSMNLR